MDYLTEFFDKYNFGAIESHVRPHIICKDGTKLSVQASHFHYCFPRDDYGPYTKVEVYYYDGDFLIFAKNYVYKDEPAAYVPVELVNEYIGLHGGIDFDEMENNYVG